MSRLRQVTREAIQQSRVVQYRYSSFLQLTFQQNPQILSEGIGGDKRLNTTHFWILELSNFEPPLRL